MPIPAYRIGIDIGGTKTCAVVVDDNARIVGSPVEVKTGRERPPAQIIDTLASVYAQVASRVPESTGVTGLGLAIATTLDDNGCLVTCPNLPTMGGINLKRELEQLIGQKVVIENDANCQAYGEWQAGAAKGYPSCCVAAIGTGFGVGIIIDGRVYRGAHGSAGEVCYSPAADGRNVEDIVCGPGITAAYERLTGLQADARDIARRARTGDADAVRVWNEFGETLGFALSYIGNILDPGVIVIGGSLSNAYDCFKVPMRSVLTRHFYDRRYINIKISALGVVAAAVGAAMLSDLLDACE